MCWNYSNSSCVILTRVVLYFTNEFWNFFEKQNAKPNRKVREIFPLQLQLKILPDPGISLQLSLTLFKIQLINRFTILISQFYREAKTIKDETMAKIQFVTCKIYEPLMYYFFYRNLLTYKRKGLVPRNVCK